VKKCDACFSNPGFIRVLKGGREVWGPCICNANHQDTPCSTCALCVKRKAQQKEINAS
jgi:hypothetical protein